MTEQQYGRRAVETGPTGQTVAENIARLRKVRGLSTRQLSAALKQAGRNISPSGITRMEKADRHVTADELVALAAVFGVSPSALLLPLDDAPDGTLEITGVGAVPADAAWDWMDGRRPLELPEGDTSTAMLDYALYSRPPRRRRPRNLRARGERTPEELRANREFFEQLAAWGAVDVDVVRRQDPEVWSDEAGD